jgi:hypothetical protein
MAGSPGERQRQEVFEGLAEDLYLEFAAVYSERVSSASRCRIW